MVDLLLKNNSDVNIATKEGLTPLHICCMNNATDIIIELLKKDVFIDMKLDYYKSKKEMDRFLITMDFTYGSLTHDHSALWFHLIQSTDIESIDERVIYFVGKYPALAKVVDKYDRVAEDVATAANKKAIKSVLLLYGRYRLLDTIPEHVSATCYVYRAEDEEERDESNVPRRVALKFMRVKSQFVREIQTRQDRKFEQDYVIGIARTHPALSELDKWDDEIEMENISGMVLTKEKAQKMFCLVMPLADRNMYMAMKQERWAGTDWKEIKHTFTQLVHCMQHLH